MHMTIFSGTNLTWLDKSHWVFSIERRISSYEEWFFKLFPSCFLGRMGFWCGAGRRWEGYPMLPLNTLDVISAPKNACIYSSHTGCTSQENLIDCSFILNAQSVANSGVLLFNVWDNPHYWLLCAKWICYQQVFRTWMTILNFKGKIYF